MVNRAVNWLKNNRVVASLVLILLLVIVWLAVGKITPKPMMGIGLPEPMLHRDTAKRAPMMETENIAMNKKLAMEESMDSTDIANIQTESRMVSRNAYLSLVVKDIAKTMDDVINYINQNNGFLVSSSQNKVRNDKPKEIQPLIGDSGVVTVRVPSEKLEETLEYFRSQSIKVYNENIDAHDITDSYKDIESRLEILRNNQSKIKEIMNRSDDIQVTLDAQREVLNLQNQIDSLLGEKKYLEESSQYSKVTVSLFSDESDIPFTPDNMWRPELIFKKAVRALISTLQFLGTSLIWIAVFSIFWVPAIFIVRKFYKKNKS